MENIFLSLIFLLFFSGSPSAIRWFIIPVVVYTVYGMFFCWRKPHIVEKVYKLMPAFTHNNATTAIIMIIGMVFVVASLSHGSPTFVNSLPSQSMCCLTLNGMVMPQTTTRHGSTRGKAGGMNYFFSSTLTLAKITSVVALILHSIQNCPATKLESSEVSKYHKPIIS